MIARYSTAVATGSFVTLGLFLLMNALIALQPGAQVDVPPRVSVGWVRVPPEETLNTDQFEPIDKRFVDPPVTPPRPVAEPGEKVTVGVTTSPPPPATTMGLATGPVLSDGPLVAMVRVQPIYPIRAQERGLDGWVIVEFDVLADGSVANVQVIGSSSSLFDDAAVKAAYRFRFRPRTVDGVPLATPGVRNRFTFTMEN